MAPTAHRNHARAHYSQRSVASLASQPGRAVLASDTLGWRSLYVQERECPTDVPAFEASPTDDQTIVVFLGGAHVLESWNGRRWDSSFRWPGTAGLTAPGEPDRLRWGNRAGSAGDSVVRALYIYLPERYLVDAREAFARTRSARAATLSALFLDDQTIGGVATGLVAAMRAGAPESYAEAAALHLATHLTHVPLGYVSQAGCARLEDRRIRRAIDYMHAHLESHLSIDALARAACISPFHFVRVFTRHTGDTPMQHVTRLRMERADHLLAQSDLPVSDVAARCGYRSVTAFSAVVRRYFGRSPREHRSRR